MFDAGKINRSFCLSEVKKTFVAVDNDFFQVIVVCWIFGASLKITEKLRGVNFAILKQLSFNESELTALLA